jgi:hypothetical protein
LKELAPFERQLASAYTHKATAEKVSGDDPRTGAQMETEAETEIQNAINAYNKKLQELRASSGGQAEGNDFSSLKRR